MPADKLVWEPLRQSEDECQFIAFQQKMVKRIAEIFGISPQMLGVRVIEGTVEEVDDGRRETRGETATQASACHAL